MAVKYLFQFLIQFVICQFNEMKNDTIFLRNLWKVLESQELNFLFFFLFFPVRSSALSFVFFSFLLPWTPPSPSFFFFHVISCNKKLQFCASNISNLSISRISIKKSLYFSTLLFRYTIPFPHVSIYNFTDRLQIVRSISSSFSFPFFVSLFYFIALSILSLSTKD